MTAYGTTELVGEKMKITCPHCGFTASADASRVPSGETTVGCPKCRNRFQVARESSAPAVSGEKFDVICPSCAHEQEFSGTCGKCGLIFARYRPPAQKVAAEVHSPQPKPMRRIIGRPHVLLLAVAVVSAVAAFVLLKDRVIWNSVPVVAKRDVLAVATGSGTPLRCGAMAPYGRGETTVTANSATAC